MADSTFMVEIIRSTLADYENRVANEEAAGAEFVDNLVRTLDSELVNIATFKDLPAGQLVDLPHFVPLGQLPAGQQPVWTGVVLIDGRNTAVHMFRQ
jgi:hypothetical protein